MKRAAKPSAAIWRGPAPGEEQELATAVQPQRTPTRKYRPTSQPPDSRILQVRVNAKVTRIDAVEHAIVCELMDCAQLNWQKPVPAAIPVVKLAVNRAMFNENVLSRLILSSSMCSNFVAKVVIYF